MNISQSLPHKMAENSWCEEITSLSPYVSDAVDSLELSDACEILPGIRSNNTDACYPTEQCKQCM